MQERTDVQYWNEYYRQRLAEDHPSPFALFVRGNLSEGETLIDLGCGNGRDALYFCRSGLGVTAIDQSETGIAMIQDAGQENLECICGDITKTSSHCDGLYNNAYSRFVIHALTEEQQHDFIKEVHKVLGSGGRFWIEVRGVQDTLYGKGEPSGRNAFVHDGHYRRFIVLDELTGELEAAGFEIEEAAEMTGFAPYRGEDPIVIRITARKK